ncbi:MAG: hypothetical protein AVDCRST_MAG32-1023, partial [uncultured Nocardioides sp.]
DPVGIPGGADPAPQRGAHAQQLRPGRVGARGHPHQCAGRARRLPQAPEGRL